MFYYKCTYVCKKQRIYGHNQGYHLLEWNRMFHGNISEWNNFNQSKGDTATISEASPDDNSFNSLPDSLVTTSITYLQEVHWCGLLLSSWISLVNIHIVGIACDLSHFSLVESPVIYVRMWPGIRKPSFCTHNTTKLYGITNSI